MTQPSQPQPASTPFEPRYSYKQLHLEAETIVVGAYGIGAVYQVLKEIRDDERKPLLAAIAERDARIATLEAQIVALTEQTVADGWAIADLERRLEDDDASE